MDLCMENGRVLPIEQSPVGVSESENLKAVILHEERHLQDSYTEPT